MTLLFGDIKDAYEVLLEAIIYRIMPLLVKGSNRAQLGFALVEGERGNRRQRGKNGKE